MLQRFSSEKINVSEFKIGKKLDYQDLEYQKAQLSNRNNTKIKDLCNVSLNSLGLALHLDNSPFFVGEAVAGGRWCVEDPIPVNEDADPAGEGEWFPVTRNGVLLMLRYS